MDWNGLKTFLMIAETGSLSGAAKQLGVNHSTVYRRLQGFESDIGAKLFNQQGNRYVLTETGEALATQGARIQSDFESIERNIVGKERQPKGVVRITAPFNLANRVIAKALKEFRHTYPDIHIEVLSSNQSLNMNSRIADIAVRATAKPPEHLIGKKVCSFPWSVYASDEYLQSAPSFKKEQDLAKHAIIGGAGSMMNLPAFSWLEKHFSNRITTRCDELTAMSFFAQHNHGVALLPLDQERTGLTKLLEIKAIPASQIWLLTHPDLRKTERVRLVLDVLTQYFEQQNNP